MCAFFAASFQKYKYLCGWKINVQKGKENESAETQRRRARDKKYRNEWIGSSAVNFSLWL
jgi:hypothetical protein